ncbi:MAG: PHP domain-containing protein, partial [Candidatus Marinimicrobia bacterium]|nr:PHP domain-containing protein [Candidatus Neomarinimicrobiota bacterium]
MCVDLHLHSIYSDGTSSPQELVLLARNHGLSAISLTDHDTVDGTEEIIVHARQQDIIVIPGLEISTVHREYTLHILGYGIDHRNRELHQWLTHLQKGRTERNNKILCRLQQLGLDIVHDELQAVSCCGQTGRPHIASLLVKKGIVDSMGQAFN